MVSYTPEEVNFYIMDFGGETLKVFENSPYVGDILYTNDKDKLENLLKLLETELEMRKDKFANYGGNYQNYITKSSEKLPNIVVIINFYEVLTENYEDIIENINTLSREAFKYGIYFVVTATSENSVRIKTRQNFSLTYVLQQNNESDYSSILGNIHGNLPAKYKGRGLFKRDNIYEFQTAYVNDDEYNYLVEFCDKKSKETEYRAKKIPVLPNVVDYNAIKNDITNSSNIVVGINKVKLISEKYNFSKNAINLICSEEIDNTIPFVNSLVNEVLYIKYYSNIYFMNSTDININNNLKNRIYNQKFDEFIIQINNYITEVYKVYESSNYNDEIINKQKKFMVVIFGVYDFINKLSEDTKKLLSEMMRKDNQIGLVSFVFVDNPDVIKAFSYEEWFKYGCDTSRGIYIGSGFSNQNIFKISRINSEDREEITNDYGYVINSSKQSKVKLLQDFNEQN